MKWLQSHPNPQEKKTKQAKLCLLVIRILGYTIIKLPRQINLFYHWSNLTIFKANFGSISKMCVLKASCSGLCQCTFKPNQKQIFGDNKLVTHDLCAMNVFTIHFRVWGKLINILVKKSVVILLGMHSHPNKYKESAWNHVNQCSKESLRRMFWRYNCHLVKTLK